MTQQIKMCVYCEHCEREYASVTASGPKAGDHVPAHYKCRQDYFDYAYDDIYGAWILKAMTCPDYELSHKVIEELEKMK